MKDIEREIRKVLDDLDRGNINIALAKSRLDKLYALKYMGAGASGGLLPMGTTGKYTDSMGNIYERR